MKTLFYIFILIVFTGACTEAEQTNPLVVPTCDDGILNQDEEAIDCGGRCADCEIKVPILSPCAASLAKNVVTLDNRDFVLAANEYQCSLEDYSYRITVLRGFDGITIDFFEHAIPTEDKVYTVSQRYNPGQAQITASLYYRDFIATSGEVYVTVKDGKITAELCSIKLHYSIAYSIEASGKVVCE
jgi:hypothetical protein